MRKLLAVAARELRERWLLFPASFVFGFSPLVLPAFGVDRQVMPLVGVMTSIGLGAGAAVLMGSTMLARDVANGRLGFLFSRPLSWRTIWGGKWLAALVLVVTSSLLAAIPWMAALPPSSLGGHHGDSWLRAMLDGPRSAFLLVVFVLVVGLANFGATAFRSRSPWLALDLLLLLTATWVTRRYVAPLLLYGVLPKEQVSPTVLLLPLALALLLGSVAQVAVGRTDPRRAHGAMSLAFWAVIGLTLSAAAGYWQWVRSAGPADVSVHTLTRDPAGRFIYVEGSASRGGFYPYGLLIDTVGGRWVARPEPELELVVSPGLLFSADGRFAALPESDGRGAAVVLFDLGATPPHATRVSLESSPPPDRKTSFALSSSADSVFMAHESGASIFALPSGRRVATTMIPPGWRPAATRFVDRGTARAWLVPWNASTGSPLPRAEMRVVDLAGDGTSKTLVFPIASALDLPFRYWDAVLPDADGQRLVTLDAGTHLREGSTGALLATLAAPGGQVAASFLSDGRVVVAETRLSAGSDTAPVGTTLRVFDRDGARLSEMPLDLPPPDVRVGPEVAPGRVLVYPFRLPFLAVDTLVVDVAASRVVERLSGLRPVLWFGPTASTAGPGLGSVQFLQDAAGHVVRVDFATGARTTVTGPGAPHGERIRIGW